MIDTALKKIFMQSANSLCKGFDSKLNLPGQQKYGRGGGLMVGKIPKRPWILIVGLGISLIILYLLFDLMYFFFVLLVLIVWQGIVNRKYMLFLACLLVPSLVFLMIEESTNHSTGDMDMIMIGFIIIAWQALGVTMIPPRCLFKYFLANVAGVMIFSLVYTVVYTGGMIFTMPLTEWISLNEWRISPSLIVPMIGIGIGLMSKSIMNAKPIEEQQVRQTAESGQKKNEKS